ncbi:glycosyltransferase, partial [Clostridioides difficile]|nr:glycosyltransferase [Clostridioides difficile]
MLLSIVMIVKNEEKILEKTLKSLTTLRNSIESELIIVDTGSTDDTIKISKKYTEKVYFHNWNNDFSSMRNISKSYAKGEWLLILDADEILIDSSTIVKF